MTSIVICPRGLKFFKPLTFSSTQNMINTWSKQVFSSAAKMCSSSAAQSKSQQELSKVEQSKPEQVYNPSIMDAAKTVKVTNLDKYVIYYYSQKGKYKAVTDIPDRISYADHNRAYAVQRIVGCTACMIAIVFIVFFSIQYELWAMSKTAVHGDRRDQKIAALGMDVGQPKNQLRPARNMEG